jgi:hypothetical protein
MGPENKIYCAGEGQQQFNRLTVQYSFPTFVPHESEDQLEWSKICTSKLYRYLGPFGEFFSFLDLY